MDTTKSGYKWNTKTVVILIIIIGLMFFGIGFAYGVDSTMKWVMKVGFALMEKEKINIDVDKGMILRGIQQYKTHIGGCLFLKDEAVQNSTMESLF